MERMDFKQVEQLLNVPASLALPDFEDYIIKLLERKNDTSAALKELDDRLALLQNHIQLLSLYVKQNHLLSKAIQRVEPVAYYTKQELANKYRVSIRTVTNWIVDGLEAEDVGGVKRISARALAIFKRTRSGRKTHWRDSSSS